MEGCEFNVIQFKSVNGNEFKYTRKNKKTGVEFVK